MIAGVNPVTFYVLPVLGKHAEWYPRFRDAFIGDPERDGTDGKLIVYTRTGGRNREWYDSRENYKSESGEEPRADSVFKEDIRALPVFLFDYDDDFDCTFANFVFDIPEQWRTDVDLFLAGNRPSQAYMDMLTGIYPNIADKICKMLCALPKQEQQQ